MERNQQVKWSYVGVVVALLVGVISATTSERDMPLTIMITSFGMLNICNIAQASDRTFFHRHRVLLFLVVAGVAIPPSLYLGRRILDADNWAIPYELRLLCAALLFALLIGCAMIGTYRSSNESSAQTTEMR